MTLLERLHALFQARANVIESEYIVSDPGVRLYDDALDKICKMMEKIKTEFPQKVDGCNLFDKALDKKWQNKFKNNFSKLYIDRERWNSSYGYSRFNQSALEKESLSNLCFGEGFAVAFWRMLHLVYEDFSKQREKRFHEKTPQEILDICTEFNAIALGTPFKKIFRKFAAAMSNESENFSILPQKNSTNFELHFVQKPGQKFNIVEIENYLLDAAKRLEIPQDSPQKPNSKNLFSHNSPQIDI